MPHTQKNETHYDIEVLYNFRGIESDELNFTAGRKFQLIEELNEHWWKGRIDGKTGLFQANFVKKIGGKTMNVDNKINPLFEPSEHLKTKSKPYRMFKLSLKNKCIQIIDDSKNPNLINSLPFDLACFYDQLSVDCYPVDKSDYQNTIKIKVNNCGQHHYDLNEIKAIIQLKVNNIFMDFCK